MFTMNPTFVFCRTTTRHLVRRSLATENKATTSVAEPTLNCAKALVKAHERDSFADILTANVTALQGIGPKHEEHLSKLRLKSVADLANYRFFHLAKAIVNLAQTEEDEGRLPDTQMNIHKGVDKAYEHVSLREMVKAPVAALQGISEQAGETWGHMGVKTVEDLASFKYCTWAEAVQTAAKFEQQAPQPAVNDDSTTTS